MIQWYGVRACATTRSQACIHAHTHQSVFGRAWQACPHSNKLMCDAPPEELTARLHLVQTDLPLQSKMLQVLLQLSARSMHAAYAAAASQHVMVHFSCVQPLLTYRPHQHPIAC